MGRFQTIGQVLERNWDCRILLHLVFVDYEKAFNSIEINVAGNTLIRQNIQKKYIRTFHNVNTNCTNSIQLLYNLIKIPIGQGVKQRDTTSPKLFAAALEYVFRTLDWNNKGIEMNDENLHHLRFTDDIVPFGHAVQTAEQMPKELNDTTAKVGLHINRVKTQAVRNDYCPYGTMRLDGSDIEFVDKYIYQDQQATHDHKIDDVLHRKRSAVWLRFMNILKGIKDTKIRVQLFNSIVFASTWLRRWEVDNIGNEEIKTSDYSMNYGMTNPERQTQR